MRARGFIWLSRVLAALVGIGIGWNLKRHSGSPEQNAATSASESHHQRGVDGSEPTSPAPNSIAIAQQTATAKTDLGRMMQLAQAAKPEDFPALWDEFVTQPHLRLGEDIIRWSSFSNCDWLMQSWVEIDPEGALAHVIAINSDDVPRSSRSIDACLRYWLKSDPQAALAKIDSTDWEAAGLPEKRIIYALAPHDPLLALERYEKNGVTSYKGTILREWAERDPAAALEYARGEEGKAIGGSEMIALARGWPLERLSEFLPLVGNDSSAARHIARRLSRPDSPLQFDDILTLPAGAARTLVLDRYLYETRGKTETIASLATIPLEELSEFDQLDRLFGGGVENPSEAWRTALALPEETRRILLNKAGVGELSHDWAQEDGAAALAAMHNLPEEFSQQRDNFATGIAKAMGRKNPEEAIRMATELPPGERPQFLETLAMNWAATDPIAFETYLQETPEDAETQAIRQGGFKTIAENNPAVAAELLDLLDDQKYTENVAHLTRSWAHTDPTGAAEFVAQLPAGKLRDDAAAELGDTLVELDPIAAAQAFLQIGDRDTREDQLLEFITDFAGKNLPAANQLIEITDMDPVTRAFLEAVIEED